MATTLAPPSARYSDETRIACGRAAAVIPDEVIAPALFEFFCGSHWRPA
jgi:hypothetical protein